MPVSHSPSCSGNGASRSLFNTQPEFDSYGFITADNYNFLASNLAPPIAQTFNTANFCNQQPQSSQQNSQLTRHVTWKDLLEPEFSINNLTYLANAISQETKTNFVNEFKERLSGNSKNNKEKVKSLRLDMFKSLCAKFNYKIVKNNLADKTGSQMIEDIHVMCRCFNNQQLDVEIFDIFAVHDNNRDIKYRHKKNSFR